MKRKLLPPLSALFLALLLSLSAFSQQWTFANRFGGTVAGFSDAIKAICTDASGNVYATGNFNTSINFGNGTATLTAVATGTATDGFVAKFNAAGLCQWSIRFGGNATDQGGLGIATNGTTVYVTGQSQFPATVAATALTSVGGGTDGIVFALNASTGAVNWARAFGGGATTDAGQAICMDASGNVYISGIFATRTTNPVASFGTAGAFNRTVQGSISQATTDMFVAQLNGATGTFNWVSAGGASSQETPLVVGSDNVSGSGIAFIPGLNQLVITGSLNATAASYFSNGSASPAFTLTNSGESDIYIIKMDLSGNFISGIRAGGTGRDEALGITYDAATNAAYIAGYFSSASLSGAITLTNSAGGTDEIWYARYNPAANTVAWAKNASGSANDFAFAITSSGTGQVYVTGRYQGTVSFPTATTPLVGNSSGVDDIFLVTINAETGNAKRLAIGNGTAGTDAGLAVAASTNYDVWAGGIIAGPAVNFLPASPSVSVTVGVDQELFIARYNNPPPVINTHPQPATPCAGLSASFTVSASGTFLEYQWQESADAAFTSPVTLANTGIYSNVNTATLTITDNTTVNGRYYRVIVSNSGGTLTSDPALLTLTAPSLPIATSSTTQLATASNNLYYTGSCLLIDKIVPSGASPVTNNVTSQVWIEGTVPTYSSQPFVQRHYQVTPAVNASTATATVTLYFTQGEFDAFNAAPGSILNLPADPSDAAGKANLRIGKYNGSSNNGTGLPGSYTSGVSVIDPPDANIIWNSTYNYWELTFPVTGFSGFIIQTNSFTLPVNLLSFSANLSGNDVQLNWKTTDEINNDHFELERSTDNRTFTSIASIPAITGSTTNNYNWTDAGAALLNTSRIFYRLKIVSLSGDIEYSNILVVRLDGANELVTSIVNPFRGSLQFNINTRASGRMIVRLNDMNGRVLLQQAMTVPKGFSGQSVKGMEKLVAGTYLFMIEFEGRQYTFKVVK